MALATLSVASQAEVMYRTIYGVDLNISDPITNIIAFDNRATGGGATWAFQTQGPGVQTFGNPFLSLEPTTESWLIGLTQDSGGNDHLWMTGNNTIAGSFGTDFNTFFTGYDEAVLIQAVKDFTSGLPFGNPTLEDGIAKVNAFKDANSSYLFNPTNTIGKSVVFSNGVDAGTFAVTTQAVPEPASMAVLGLGVAALARRRRKA